MGVMFEVAVHDGRRIRLTKTGWRHISREHPDVSLERVTEALQHPDLVRANHIDPQVIRYYRKEKRRKRYLLVAVKYLNDHGFVITSYYVKRIL